MSPDSTTAAAAMRTRLTTLLGREAEIGHHLRGEDGRRGADFEDVVSYTANDEVLEGLDQAARTEVEAIRLALDRIDAGTFGVCTGCGEDIPGERLAVVPHGATCLACTIAAGG